MPLQRALCFCYMDVLTTHLVAIFHTNNGRKSLRYSRIMDISHYLTLLIRALLLEVLKMMALHSDCLLKKKSSVLLPKDFQRTSDFMESVLELAISFTMAVKKCLRYCKDRWLSLLDRHGV